VIDLAPPPNQDWTFYTFRVTATDVSTVVTFGFQNDPSWTGLDDVSVEEVPEPSSVSLLLAGAIGLVIGLRRRLR
jgi:hypothetical protein